MRETEGCCLGAVMTVQKERALVSCQGHQSAKGSTADAAAAGGILRAGGSWLGGQGMGRCWCRALAPSH